VKVANTPPKRERMPLFTGVLKNQHPPQHSTNDPTITHPETPPDDSLLEMNSFQEVDSFSAFFFPFMNLFHKYVCYLQIISYLCSRLVIP